MQRMMTALYEVRRMTEAELHAREEKCDRLCIKQDEVRMRMHRLMSEEMKELFREYSELETEIHSVQAKNDYAQGFRDGLRMGAWALMREEDREA